jgi:septal ring factor EnvC (AmiA/AmiB activator)
MDPNVISTLGAAALGAIALIFTTYKKVGQEQHTATIASHLSVEQSLIQERMDMRKGYQERIDSLTKEIDSLWQMFRGMQGELVKCQQLHIEDATKISALERQNSTQQQQIQALQQGLAKNGKGQGSVF